VASSGPGAWIVGQGGVGPSGGITASGTSSPGGPSARDGAGASAAVAGGSASSFIARPAPLVATPSVAAAAAPGSPAASATFSDIPNLQRECDLANGRFSAASVEIEHLRENLRVVEVARSAIEEEAHASRDAAADAQSRAFGEFCSWSHLPSPVFLVFYNFCPQCWMRSWTPFAVR
jgi:hypothetical protein